MARTYHFEPAAKRMISKDARAAMRRAVALLTEAECSFGLRLIAGASRRAERAVRKQKTRSLDLYCGRD